MKKLVLVLVVVLVLSGIFAVAALSEVSLERDITVSISTDMDSNVAIFFEDGDKYPDVLVENDDGTVDINLGGLLYDTAQHFNNDALFVIGTTGEGEGVFKITNNTPGSIDISIEDSGNYLEIRDSDGSTGTVLLGVGLTEEFHFALDTRGEPLETVSTPISIEAKLVITETTS